jgi:membrane protein
MFLRRARTVLVSTARDFDRQGYMTRAAALAFYFLLSLFPLLIFLASALAWIPIPNLFDQILLIMTAIVPPAAMGVVRDVLTDVLRTDTRVASLSIAGAVFAASVGFSAMIDALNVAYDVKEGRPFWKKRLVAIGLTLLTGAAVTVALIVITLGPRFAEWLARRVPVGPAFVEAWPYARWTVIVVFTVLSIETIFYIAPNVRQRFLAQVPGAALALLVWIGASSGLGWYMSTFADYNKTFGALGAVVALMMWLYVSALAILLGAELNGEWLRSAGQALPPKEIEFITREPENLH